MARFTIALCLTLLSSFSALAQEFKSDNPQDLVGKTCYAWFKNGNATGERAYGIQKLTFEPSGETLVIRISHLWSASKPEKTKDAFDGKEGDPRSTKDVSVSRNSLTFTSSAGPRYSLFLVGGRLNGTMDPTTIGNRNRLAVEADCE